MRVSSSVSSLPQPALKLSLRPGFPREEAPPNEGFQQLYFAAYLSQPRNPLYGRAFLARRHRPMRASSSCTSPPTSQP